MSLSENNLFNILDQKNIIRQLKLIIKLMELHGENSFKIRSYQSAVITIDRGDISLEGKEIEDLQTINGIGKSIAEVIYALSKTQTHPYLDELLQKTPTGVLDILEIKGLGPKKVKILWDEMNITSTHELMEACQSGQVAKIKGFGEKTQEGIIQAMEFQEINKGKWLYADLDDSIHQLEILIQNIPSAIKVTIVGDFARNLEIIETVEILVATEEIRSTVAELNRLEFLDQDKKLSSPFKWRGKLEEPGVSLVIHFCKQDDFIKEKILRTGSSAHLLYPVQESTPFVDFLKEGVFKDENEVYQKAGLSWIPEELREGFFEFELAKEWKIPILLEETDLKGILHNHSTYSDGKHTLRQMAEYCKSLGYEYLGISDHSRSAFYAGGLEIEKVQKQHLEIDALNKELAPFRIFKGIESDILADGNLDYPQEVLASFDFVVSSVHSALSMDRKKATARLLKAIQNPYTTILGHPTGRLLLRREGYPVDHKVIIDACAANQVVIEINANPWRLDLDWRWVHYALESGVKLSVNPDAHAMEGYHDMRYGVLIGRKGGLTKDMTFNSLSLAEMDSYFLERKKARAKT